ncbi:hypothetical protein GGQ84_001347 [Desulfitispora alkaliphila]
MFEGEGEILLKNGDVAVTAHGKYMKVPIEKIVDSDVEEYEWKTIETDEDPVEIDI